MIEIIDNSWAGEKAIPPYYIYLKTAYHLSEEARSGIKEFAIPIEFRKSLFDFQQTAVKIAARHLNNDKRGGAMIGDVVGLGKTITACAIAKMYENSFGSNTLIIRPEAYIRQLGGERKFAERHEDFIRSIKAFERSECQEDWQELMKLFLVRRTRTFIKENYSKTDPMNGRKHLEFYDGHKSYFPDRIPKAIKFKTKDGDQYSRLYSAEMISMMESLELPRYGLIQYLDEKKAGEASKFEQGIIENLSRAGARMMGFCKNFFDSNNRVF